MDNEERIIARIPTPLAGPPRLITNSGVATITYIKSKTTIPVPEILSWNDDSSNPVGAEYIFMRTVGGVQLHSRLTSMTSIEHLGFIKSISDMVAQMTTLEFPDYGSLYFANAPISQEHKKAFVEGFCVGPHCGPVYWNCGAGEADLYSENNNHGPWSDLANYCNGLIASAASRLPKPNLDIGNDLSYRGSIEDHLRLIRDSKAVLNELIKAPLLQAAAKPTILHADLHKRNIFLCESEPTKITGLIDWQSTSIEPAFMYANETPDFAAVDALGDASETTCVQGLEESTEKRQRDIQLCATAFDAARAVDEAILRPFRHCNTTWRDSATALRDDLIELSRNWESLGLPGVCPYQPDDEEMTLHKKSYEDFEAVLGLKSWLIQNLGTNSEGWIPADMWEKALPAYREAYKQWIEMAKEKEASGDRDMSEEKAEKLWPFDQR